MPKKLTLKFTLISAFCGLSLIGSILLTVVTSYEVKSFIREQLRLRITDTANIMATQIDGELHQSIQTVEDDKSDAYIKLKNALQIMREHGTGIANAYTMRKQENGEFAFIVDGSEKDQNATGDIYPQSSVTPMLNSALNINSDDKSPRSETDIYKDDWGVWLSAYAPIFTKSGQFDGIVGIDVSAQSIQDQEFKYIVTISSISLVCIFLMMPLGFVFASRIRRPLEALTTEMEKIGRFELNDEIFVPTRIYEINRMVQRLESMRRGLRSFEKYVPSDLVRDLIELGRDAKLGGEKKNLTIFFSDIANFTSISERLEPEKLVGFLGEYLTVVNDALSQNQATVDKYIGDSVMAFWGAPRNVENPAIKSCQAALECQRKINLLSQKWQSNGLDVEFKTRIGIHTGDVIVGNIGSETRMNYTIIGDNVNLASRIESANKFYGTSILVSETTHQQAKKRFVMRLIDFAVLNGKSTPIRLYELVGYKGDMNKNQLYQIELFEKAFHFYTERRFPMAIFLLNRLLK
ncbi:MAG: adenylate/guanylate cyclase domain-containing protein, partial [Methylococcales bacterium]